MLVTNSTPFPIQTNRWYVGVFNTTATNVSFAAQACVNLGSPVIIPLTNGVPFVVPAARQPLRRPARTAAAVLLRLPHQQLRARCPVRALQPVRRRRPGAAAGSASGHGALFRRQLLPRPTPEQIVVRTSADVPDLRGHWYLGVYNNETTNVAYTLRAVLPDTNGLLVSAQPLQVTLTPLNPPQGLLLSWNSVEGERYFVQYTASIAAPVTWTNLGFVIATTPLTTFEVLPVPTGPRFTGSSRRFRRLLQPTLHIQLWPTNQVRLSWSTAYPGYTLQSKTGLFGTWANAGLTVNVVGNEYVAFDTIGSDPKYYRLFK